MLSPVYGEVHIGRYFACLDKHGIDLNGVSIEDLRPHLPVLTDEDGISRDRFSIHKSLVFDTTLEDAASETSHLCKGTGAV